MLFARKINITCFIIICLIVITTILLVSCNSKNDDDRKNRSLSNSPWYGWNKYQIKPEDSLVRLGHDLIENTSYYFGPKGKIAAISNGMNCQNCHIDGGTIPYGNNFSAVIATYPRFNNRSNDSQSIASRVNDCFERSLNGKAIDTTGLEMRAFLAYFHWLGDDIPKGKKPLGSGVPQLKYMDRSADPSKGKMVFVNNCQRCHGNSGEGQPNATASGYIYPPLWGANSYNTGAGMYRLSSCAGFIKNNMPLIEASYQHPKLKEEEAWDVAAFINSQPRPVIQTKNDYPNLARKPIDNPTGPYIDTFSEAQHKYGPFKPIKLAMDKLKK